MSTQISFPVKSLFRHFQASIFIVATSLCCLSCAAPHASPPIHPALTGEKRDVHVGEGDETTSSHDTPPAPVPPVYKTVTISSKELALPLHLAGLVEPDFGKEVDVTSRIAGRVQKVLVRPGDNVVKHSVMAIIDSKDVTELQAELIEADSKLKIAKAHQERERMIYEEQVERPKGLIDAQTSFKEERAKRDLAETEFKRVEDLYREKISSGRDFNAAKSALARAQASYEQSVADLERERHLYENRALMQHDFQVAKAESARAKQHHNTLMQRLEFLGMTQGMLEQMEKSGKLSGEISITAPVAGVVTRQEAEAGEVVHSDKPMFTITDLSSVVVRADVPELAVSRVKLGSKVKIKVLSYPDETFIGNVNFISEHVNPNTHTVSISAQLNNISRRFKKDMSAEIDLEAQMAHVLICPKEAVIEKQGKDQVLVQTRQGTFEAHDVFVGGFAGDSAEILTGIEEGDEVAVGDGKPLTAH